ncbi:hypothetical protein Q9L42_003280 [Methylomarinum sp. Ch1-1]|uniref:Uncharacterized protein n=1 Tax=Methylomarinum roseum TaxID=3067653 RepID=A0AAU7NVX7_9GAMM
MCRNFSNHRRYFDLLFFCGLLLASASIRAIEPPSPSSPQPSKEPAVQQRLAEIKQRQAALTKQNDSFARRLSVAKNEQRSDAAQQLQTILTTLARLNASYDQQLIALERHHSLTSKKQQYQEPSWKNRRRPSNPFPS